MQIVPNEFAAYREKLENTRTTYIKVLPSGADIPISVFKSKFRGQPYWPKGLEYPTDGERNRMHFLAQINFSEVPENALFPRDGILQFYISCNGTYGLQYADPYSAEAQFQLQTTQSGFHIVYHAEPLSESGLLSDSVAPDFDESPIDRECELRFEFREEYMPACDKSFDVKVGKSIFELDGEWNDQLHGLYWQTIDSSGCKLGGYPYFTQDDVRKLVPDDDDEWILLLQVDQTEEVGIMWGDGGVGNFFIRKSDLEIKNFGRVLYNWDCC